jgi:putative restriction endonuclease
MADLFVDGRRVGRVRTRYQHQTWGGSRAPERRLTGNLGALRKEATAGDCILFTKDLYDDGYIQLHLVRKDSAAHRALHDRTGGQQWGPADPANPPVSVGEMTDAEAQIEALAANPAFAFDENRPLTETVTMRRARDRAFRRKLLAQYGNRCAFTDRSFAVPTGIGIFGLDAAHIVPIAAGGSDHPANGILLTKDMHWALDNGLIGVAPERTIYVPEAVRSMQGNGFLAALHGQKIREAKDQGLLALQASFDWHRTNTLIDG